MKSALKWCGYQNHRIAWKASHVIDRKWNRVPEHQKTLYELYLLSGAQPWRPPKTPPVCGHNTHSHVNFQSAFPRLSWQLYDRQVSVPKWSNASCLDCSSHVKNEEPLKALPCRILVILLFLSCPRSVVGTVQLPTMPHCQPGICVLHEVMVRPM